MKLLANENFPLTSVKLLENSGFDIVYVGKDFPGYLDNEIMELAINEERTIITFDSDYGKLIFRHGYKPKSGVIYLRWDKFLPNEPGEYLIELFNSKQLQFENMITIISRGNIRQRKY